MSFARKFRKNILHLTHSFTLSPSLEILPGWPTDPVTSVEVPRALFEVQRALAKSSVAFAKPMVPLAKSLVPLHKCHLGTSANRMPNRWPILNSFWPPV